MTLYSHNVDKLSCLNIGYPNMGQLQNITSLLATFSVRPNIFELSKKFDRTFLSDPQLKKTLTNKRNCITFLGCNNHHEYIAWFVI